MNKLYGFKTAPARCGMSESFFRDLCRTGQGPRDAVRIDDSGLAWTEGALVDWLNSRRAEPGHRRPPNQAVDLTTQALRLPAVAPFLRLGQGGAPVARAAQARSTNPVKTDQPATRGAAGLSKAPGKRVRQGEVARQSSGASGPPAQLFQGFGGQRPAEAVGGAPLPAGSLWDATWARIGIRAGRDLGAPLQPVRQSSPATAADTEIAAAWEAALIKAGGAAVKRPKR